MTRDLTALLSDWVTQGFRSIGQILITPLAHGGYELRHQDDAGCTELRAHHGAEAARRLSMYTEHGEFRPLKTAPSLARGWCLTLPHAAELRTALDHFYPAMLGIWASNQSQTLHPVPLRDTLGRQTGMYAASKRLQDDEAQALVGRACSSDGACLKRVLWPLTAEQPVSSLPSEKCSAEPDQLAEGTRAIPLLCHEACNLLVAAAREVVKTRERASAPPKAPSA
jgi:sirohydrochlorin cobaltochelatase